MCSSYAPLQLEFISEIIMNIAQSSLATAEVELELELIQAQMAQKPKLRGEVGARAWRV